MNAAALAEPISPELVLVCPELRSRALELLPDPPFPSPSPRAPLPDEPDSLAPLPVRVAVYAARRAATTAAEGIVLAGGVSALALVLTTLS